MADEQAKFSVITPTGDRPESFSICAKLMERQTLKPAEWIVIDDGTKEQTLVPNLDYVKYIKRNRSPRERGHTIIYQMQAALELVTTDRVVIIEDDDWYSELYLAEMCYMLSRFDLVGHTHNIYYFIRQRQYFIHGNVIHSSFCSTAFTRNVFGFFDHLQTHSPYIDLALWRNSNGINKLLYRPYHVMVLGMKQLPGRTGPTYDSNRAILKGGIVEDSNLAYLQSIVDEDIELYRPYAGADK